MKQLWVYLGASPLLWLLLTLGVYVLALRLQRRLGGSPWANPVLVSVAGNALNAVLAMAVVHAWGAPEALVASIAPKGVTAPVAMAIAERLGGLPSLTAVLVIGSGIVGATLATPLLNAAGIRDWAARGLAVGLTAHGIGTARAFQVNPVAGTFAGVAMAASTVITAAVVPLLVPLFAR